MSARLVELSDSDSDLDQASAAPNLGLVIAQVDTSQEIEEEGMDLKPRSGLRGLLSNRNKGQFSNDALKEQPTSKTPPPLPSSSDPTLQSMPNLRWKRPVEELEEGEVGPEKAKHQKKGKEPKEKRTNGRGCHSEGTTDLVATARAGRCPDLLGRHSLGGLARTCVIPGRGHNSSFCLEIWKVFGLLGSQNFSCR